MRFRFRHDAAYRAIPFEVEAYRMAGTWVGAVGAARRHADAVTAAERAAPPPG